MLGQQATRKKHLWGVCKLLNITNAAKELGVSVDTLRYYEKEGIVAPKRSSNGYRYYDDNDLKLLKYVIVLRCARFTIAEIKDMNTAPVLDSRDDCNQAYAELLGAKILELKQTIEGYQQIVTLLESGLAIAGSTATATKDQEQLDEFVAEIFTKLRKDGCI